MNRAVNWSYISGFFDADGAVTLKSKTKFRPSIQFYNTELSILEKIRDFIAYQANIEGVIYTDKLRKAHHSQSYTLTYGKYKDVLTLTQKINSHHAKKFHRFSVIYKLKNLTLPIFDSYKIESFYNKKEAKTVKLKVAKKAA